MKRPFWISLVFGIPVLAVIGLYMARTVGTGEQAPQPEAIPQTTAAHPTAPAVDVAPVVARRLDRTMRLPGELQPYLSVDLYPKVTGLLKWIEVDRGSKVSEGQVLAKLVAPELTAQRLEAEAKLRSDEMTYRRLAHAAATPGVVAPHDLEVAGKTVEADRAHVRSLQALENYLTVTAPFDGMITARHVHPGALVGPNSGTGARSPLVRIEQHVRLRLLVPVPEASLGHMTSGQSVAFTVVAHPSRLFSGTIARIAGSLDRDTRTMPVELDVDNTDGHLAPGMFPEVIWPLRRAEPSLFVPATSVVTTTERTFVIRVQQGKAEWVHVRKGHAAEDLVEVFGDLEPGDLIVARASDELRPGTRVTVQSPAQQEG